MTYLTQALGVSSAAIVFSGALIGMVIALIAVGVEEARAAPGAKGNKLAAGLLGDDGSRARLRVTPDRQGEQ